MAICEIMSRSRPLATSAFAAGSGLNETPRAKRHEASNPSNCAAGDYWQQGTLGQQGCGAGTWIFVSTILQTWTVISLSTQTGTQTV